MIEEEEEEEEVHRCFYCDDVVNFDNGAEYGETIYCIDCFDRMFAECPNCEVVQKKEDINSLGYCCDCLIECSECFKDLKTVGEIEDGLCRKCLLEHANDYED
jgi:hypothetical protein